MQQQKKKPTHTPTHRGKPCTHAHTQAVDGRLERSVREQLVVCKTAILLHEKPSFTLSRLSANDRQTDTKGTRNPSFSSRDMDWPEISHNGISDYRLGIMRSPVRISALSDTAKKLVIDPFGFRFDKYHVRVKALKWNLWESITQNGLVSQTAIESRGFYLHSRWRFFLGFIGLCSTNII